MTRCDNICNSDILSREFRDRLSCGITSNINWLHRLLSPTSTGAELWWNYGNSASLNQKYNNTNWSFCLYWITMKVGKHLHVNCMSCTWSKHIVGLINHFVDECYYKVSIADNLYCICAFGYDHLSRQTTKSQ